MKFRKLSAISMAGIMAATSIVCQISASALEDKVMFTGSQPLKFYVDGSSDHELTLPTALTGTELSDYENISITFTFTDAEITDLSGNQWKAQHLFNLCIDGGVLLTENTSIGIDAYGSMPTANTEYTVDYKTDLAQEILTKNGGDFSKATALTIQTGWTTSTVKKVAFTDAKNNLPDKTLEYDGSPITMTKSFPEWAPAGHAQRNIPVTSLDGIELNKTTYGELKKMYKSLACDGIKFVKDSLGGSAEDYSYSLYTVWATGSNGWRSTSGVSLDKPTKWFFSDITDVADDAAITEIGIQVNTSKLSEGVKALKDGETFTINPKDAVETSITLDQPKLSLKAGETATLKATTTPADAEVTWKSSNDNIATVKDGVVTAVAAGEATITATAGGKSAECVVTVSAAAVEPGDKPDAPSYDTLKEVKVSDFNTDGSKELYVKSITPNNAKEYSEYQIKATLSNGKSLTKTTSKCFREFKYVNTSGDTVTKTSDGGNYFIVVKIINIPAGVTVDSVSIEPVVG